MEIGILFLASHPITPGIHQLHLWKEWVATNEKKIRIVIHIDTKDRSVVGDWDKYCIDNPVKTQWGTDSLVEAHLQVLKECYERYPKVSEFFLVSGSCIPIQPVATFCSLKGSFFNIVSVERPDKLEWQKQLINSGASKQLAAKSIQTEQWCILSREHVQILLSESFHNKTGIWSFFKKIQQNLASEGYVPDEYFIYWFLRCHGVTEKQIKDKYLMLSFRKNADSPSPITFDSLDTPYKVFWDVNKKRNIKLGKFLLKEKSDSLLFRKVSASCKINLSDIIITPQQKKKRSRSPIKKST
jgi:hypothetical protein